MPRILVLYYSSFGHVETMAQPVARGPAEVDGTGVSVKRVREIVPEKTARGSGYQLDPDAPIAAPSELVDYDGVIFGTPARYGMMAAQMRSYLYPTGALWQNGSLIGKVGSVFASTATQHGGQEITILSFHTTLLHLGFVIAGLPYSAEGQTRLDQITGGSPFGATTTAAGDGSREPSGNELDLAAFQGRHVAGLTARLAG
jgi:NAD(P)H dehydrogenase (quinone)